MSADDEKIRKVLLERRRELETLTDIAADGSAPVTLDQQSVGRLSRMDAMQRQAMSQEQERRRAGEILRIERALQRLEEGEYGICAECGEDISANRLSADPAAHLCITCARMGER
ncbi:MAG: TraR/DksA C4-type zinc finger protein [Rhodobiaceae bacterium]|nr:TraR/DksA C4-type zinc finger protein [Rhodobiaceae bacterium]MCC0013451.1 TraR/DksA C4-type zinc finger protein [Rhodobiaceae bacterium]MCC0018262.1 TraR/DksA C4-type zinc finger protein [Rhodobiaceae bacterium]MCC0060496.1 TraR/DksA C4-type zinc finger protein [Rhodobiaceae bacterium]